jgi:hypothetical protein
MVTAFPCSRCKALVFWARVDQVLVLHDYAGARQLPPNSAVIVPSRDGDPTTPAVVLAAPGPALTATRHTCDRGA